jgi:dienelactone hydrolase
MRQRPERRLGETTVEIPAGPVTLHADLSVPAGAQGLVIFAHGSGSSRHSPRNRAVAEHLKGEGLATLLLDLLTSEEDAQDSSRFDLHLMTARLETATSWAARYPETSALPVGYFGASTGAAVALLAAAELGLRVRGVVSRGGRPDLLGSALAKVSSPTLLLVGSRDDVVLGLNRLAYEDLGCSKKDFAIIPGATHLFEEENALQDVARRAAHWFRKYLPKTSHLDEKREKAG